MQCEDVRNQFADYLTDRLEASATAAVLKHLSSCPACKEEADALETLWAEMGTVPDTPADIEALSGRFGKVLDTYAHGVKATAPRPRRRFISAAVLIVTVAIGLYAGHRSGLLYVPTEAVEAVTQRVEMTGRIEAALAEISAINLELLARGELT